ncbi:MAG TPA: DUF4388 domain-containing protein [Polyangiaceae bacterium]|nr:DUF4388 domain-containing protein [Polyangiaceae bacterium]
MAFGGNLEDLPFSDIIQLLHVSKKSGSLSVEGQSGTARIVCRAGFIIDASFPGDTVSISSLLLKAELVTRNQLDLVRSRFLPQQIEGAQLVMSLIDADYLTREDGIEELKELIHQTLAEIIALKEGEFWFEPDELEAEGKRDEMFVDMAPWIGVDTQGALMDAFRVFDEKNRSLEEQKERKKERIKEVVARITMMPEPPAKGCGVQLSDEVPPTLREAILKGQENDEKDLLSVLEEMDEETLDQVLAPPMHALILSADSFTKYTMHSLCRDSGICVTISELEVDLREAYELGARERRSMALIIDLGDGEFESLGCQRRMAIAARMKSHNPELPLVFLSNTTENDHTLRLFELGARTVLHKPGKPAPESAAPIDAAKSFNAVVLGCLKGIFREEYRLRLAVQESRSEMASLKKRVQEIQDRQSSIDISIIILQFVSELLQRGIIFLVRKTDLLGLGSFGVSSHSDTISTAAMRIRIPLESQSIFAEVVSRGMVHHGACEDEILKNSLYSHIGAPASPEFLILPLKTENRTIAVVYGDFGGKPANPPFKTDALEILASQAGMAMEVALQRSRNEKKVG